MGMVYVLRLADTDLFKIGLVRGGLNAVHDRVKQLNTGNPDQLILIDTIETEEPALCESFLHRILANHKYRGNGGKEFFQLNPTRVPGIVRKARRYIGIFTAKNKRVQELQEQTSQDLIIEPNEELKNIVKRLIAVRVQIQTLECKKELLELQLKIKMGTACELAGIASWKSSLVKYFDQSAFKSACPYLYEQYKKERWQRPFKLLG